MRRTGKTTKAILRTVSALCDGKRGVVVLDNMNLASHFKARVHSVLSLLCPDTILYNQQQKIQLSNGAFVMFTSSENLATLMIGMKLDFVIRDTNVSARPISMAPVRTRKTTSSH